MKKNFLKLNADIRNSVGVYLIFLCFLSILSLEWWSPQPPAPGIQNISQMFNIKHLNRRIEDLKL